MSNDVKEQAEKKAAAAKAKAEAAKAKAEAAKAKAESARVEGGDNQARHSEAEGASNNANPVPPAPKTGEAPKAEKPPQVEQNGVKRPYEDTKAGQIWGLADTLSAEKKAPVSLKELVEAGTKADFSASTITGEYSKWRKFYGITGRVEDPEAQAKRESKKAAAAEKAQRPPRVEQNGVKRPNSGTKCGDVWDLADKMSAEKKAPVSVAELWAEGEKLGWNKNNVYGEYSAWRKFHGIAGRISNPASGASLEAMKAQVEAAKSRLDKAQNVYNSLVEKLAAMEAAAQSAEVPVPPAPESTDANTPAE